MFDSWYRQHFFIFSPPEAPPLSHIHRKTYSKAMQVFRTRNLCFLCRPLCLQNCTRTRSCPGLPLDRIAVRWCIPASPLDIRIKYIEAWHSKNGFLTASSRIPRLVIIFSIARGQNYRAQTIEGNAILLITPHFQHHLKNFR